MYLRGRLCSYNFISFFSVNGVFVDNLFAANVLGLEIFFLNDNKTLWKAKSQKKFRG